jgi:uncharacterized protein
MNKLLAVISPAKLLDESLRYPNLPVTQPEELERAEYLVKVLRKKKAAEIGKMMDLSPALAELNWQRYKDWNLPFTPENATPAILLFKGDVYRGMAADTFSDAELKVAQKQLRILSGLYGVLRPLDLIQGYRLMMGTPFAPDAKHKNLYSFWSEKMTMQLKKDLHPTGTLINLASQEYFKVVDQALLERKVIHCEFKEKKGKDFKIVSTYAKLARGSMAAFLVKNKITKAEELKAFDQDGYCFEPKLSNENQWVFARG